MKQFLRHHIALVLVLVHALSLALPLAPLALGSTFGAGKVVACAGDCDLCGCAPLKSASRSCCCWLSKKKKSDHEHHAAETLQCCKKEQQETTLPSCSNLPCGGTDSQLAAAENEPSLPPRQIGTPRVSFLEAGLPSSPGDRPSDSHQDPPERPPEEPCRS